MDTEKIQLIFGFIITFGGIVTGFILNYQKNKTIAAQQKESAKIESDKILLKLSDIDTIQNDKIDNLAKAFNIHLDNEEAVINKITEIAHLLKHKAFYNKLSTKLTKIVYKMTKGINKEVGNMLFRSVQEIKLYFLEILENDFENLEAEIIEFEIITRAKKVRSSITDSNLEMSEHDISNFKTNIKVLLKQSIKEFSSKLISIVEQKTNGERRLEFEKLCEELIYSEIKHTVNCYNEIKKPIT